MVVKREGGREGGRQKGRGKETEEEEGRGGGRDGGEEQEEGRIPYSASMGKPMLICYHFNVNYCCSVLCVCMCYHCCCPQFV